MQVKKWLRMFVVMLWVFSIHVSACDALQRIVPETSKETVIAAYLQNKSLDPVEGVWSAAVNGNSWEVAIIKNPSTTLYKTWQYVGIVVNPLDLEAKIGEVKIALNKTAAEGVYSGTYVVQTGGAWGTQTHTATNFMTTQANMMQASVPAVGALTLVKVSDSPGKPAGKGPAKGIATGTGFFVTPSVIITNHHVIADAKKVEVTYLNEYTLSAKVLSKDAKNDIAVLEVTGLESKVIPLPMGTAKSVKEGERVYTIGFPMSSVLGTNHKISEGIINSLTGMHDDPTRFQISIPIQHGNSGGPLITNDGRVIGITSASLNTAYFIQKTGSAPQNVNFAVKADYILPIVDLSGAKVQLMEPGTVLLDPVKIMDVGKKAVVFIKSYLE